MGLDDREQSYPHWSEGATKGEVMQALLKQRIATGRLAGALIAQMRGETREAAEALREYFAADQAIDDYASSLGEGTPHD